MDILRLLDKAIEFQGSVYGKSGYIAKIEIAVNDETMDSIVKGKCERFIRKHYDLIVNEDQKEPYSFNVVGKTFRGYKIVCSKDVYLKAVSLGYKGCFGDLINKENGDERLLNVNFLFLDAENMSMSISSDSFSYNIANLKEITQEDFLNLKEKLV